MQDEQIFITKELRMRLIQLEYKNLPEEQLIQEIERIYLEETGELLPAEVNVYTSSESSKLKEDSSGYDGTALLFSSEDNNIDEVYIISQGSQGIVDWSYNIESMLAGKNYSQAEATHDFTVDALEEFGITFNENEMDQVEIPVVGLHSLAHNNNITSYLLYDTFSKVYSVNGAQTNYYQLFDADGKFEKRLKDEFPVLEYDLDAIYSLPPADIEAIAKDFYADKAKNIYQDISIHDPLYAISGVRGFFTLGNVTPHKTSDNHQGLRRVADKIPDDAVVALQKLAIDYTVAKENGSMEDIIKDLTGVDMAVVEQFDGLWGSAKTYFGSDFTEMVPGVNEKLPGLIENVQLITGNAEVIFDELMGATYITKNQRDELVEVFTEIEKELLLIQESFASIEFNRSTKGISAIGSDLSNAGKLYSAIQRLTDLFGQLNKEEYQDILDMIVAGHSIGEMINAIGEGEKSYLNGDLLMAPSNGGGGKDIWVNISAALRMYTEGKVVLEERTEEITRLVTTIGEEVTQFFKHEKKRLLDKINDIEQNPSAYSGMVQEYATSTVKGVERITVYDVITSKLNADHDSEIRLLNMSVTDGYTFIEKYRKAIEDMFDEEAKIAERFNLAEVVFGD
ncbi:MAG TPA: DUF6792 domain-containing protein [Candidatus Avamphibacillus sp.]|nr:DUF6792 domain-containing protein [Candidatus Avamphibacillus sp.]